jgi:hypothetical protein
MTTRPAALGDIRLFRRRDDEQSTGRTRRFDLLRQGFWLAVFWGTFASTLVAIAWLSLLSRQQSFDTGGARQIRRLGARAYEAQFAGRLPPGCVVGCAGFQLTKAASAEAVLREAGGYWIDTERGIVRWSPRSDSQKSDAAIPIAVLVVPGKLSAALGKKLLLFWIPAAILAAAGLVLATGNRARSGSVAPHRLQQILARGCAGFALTVPSSLAMRIVLVLAVELGLVFTLIPDWSRLVTCPDSRSYVENWPIRAPLTAWWIAAFDSERAAPRAGSVTAERRTIAYWGPCERYVTAVRVWKVLFVGSVGLFAWCLASVVPWWMVASFLLAAAAFDGSRGPWSTGMSGYLDVLLSEPLSYSLLLLLLASLCAYFARPSWMRGLTIAVCLNLLILARPASISFAALIACIWLFHWKREGLSFACRRAGGLAAIFVGGIVLHCAMNLAHSGHFRQHAFTGMNLMTTALQIADADDARAFDDSKLAPYARVAVGEALARRQSPFTASAADANCWQIAVPAYAAVSGMAADAAPFDADDVLTRVARGIIRRHPREFCRLAASSFWNGFWQTWLHVPLLVAGAAGCWLFLRSGDWRFLFVACLAALPFVGIIPACVTNYPIDRYRSLTSFAAVCSLPLLIGVVVARSTNRLRGSLPRHESDRRDALEPVSLVA